MTAAEVRAALDALVTELVGAGVPARITIYGGAALALVHYERVATGDVDASFFPTVEVERAAAAVGDRLELRRDWLNRAATQFLPPLSDDAGGVIVLERDGVVVSAASAQLLLAMKLRASRPGRDGDDIAVLVRACGVQSVEQAEAVVEQVYLGEEAIPHRGYALLDRALGAVTIRVSGGTLDLPPVA